MKSKSENPAGLHRRYIVKKADGEPVDRRAEYFVLRLDEHAKDKNHVRACRIAIQAYADHIEPFLPQLAAEIRSKYVPYVGWPKP